MNRLIANLSLALVAAAVLSCASISDAQQKRTEHTYKLAEGQQPPAATLADVAWLVGSWRGQAFGSQFEEVWNPASNGSMVGMFKLLSDDSVAFYELLLLVEEGGSLSLKVKHFNADFSAWEEKPDYINFRLVKLEKDAVHFGGLSFYRRGDDAIDGYIVMRGKDDSISEKTLVYQRR